MSGSLDFLQYLPRPNIPDPPPPPGWGAQALTSALRAGTSDLVGLPGEWTQRITGVSPQQNDEWRNENFWSSMASQVAGSFVPYAGALGAGWSVGRRVLPGLFSAERFAAAPIRTGAARAAVAELPFAAGRTIASPILGGDMESVALSAGIDLTIGAGIGAGAGLLWARRGGGSISPAQEAQLAQMVPAYNLTLPTQERLKVVLGFDQAARQEGPLARLLPDIEDQLRREIRTERPDGPIRMTFEGRTAAESGNLLADIYGRTQGTGRPGDIMVRRFAQASAEGFDNRQAWEAALQAANLPPNWEIATQFPRFVEPRTDAAAKRLWSNMTNNLVQAHDGWFIGRGADPEGMFMIARRIGSGPPSAQDRWFTAFTNRPGTLVADLPMMERSDRLGKFFTGLDRAESERRIAEVARVDPNSALSLYKQLEDLYPAQIEHRARKADATRYLPRWVHNLAKEYQADTSRAWTNIKGAIAPGQFQFNNAPLARNLLFKSAAIYDRAKERVGKALFGANALQGRSPAGAIALPGRGQSGGVRQTWEALEEADIPNLARVIADVDPNGLGLRRGAEGQDFDTALREALRHASDNAQAKRIEAFIRSVKAANDEALTHVNSTYRGLNMPEIAALDNRVLPHFWGGSHRWRLFDEQGRTDYMAWGRTRGEVAKHAEDAAKRLGLQKDPAGPFVQSRKEDLDEAILMRRRQRRDNVDNAGSARVPEILAKERRGVGGYMLDPDGPMPNKEELWNIVQSGVEQTEFAAADAVVKNLLGPRLAEVRAAYGPDVSQQALRRIQDMSGTQGQFAAWQNKAVERVLGTGKSGATKLAGELNRLETMFNLTFFNFGYAAVTAATPLITLMPKLGLLRTVPIENLGKYFDTLMPLGQNGVAGQVLNLPSELKMMKDGWRALRNPTQVERGMLERALKEQVIAPKFIEQEVGLKSNRAVTMQRLAKGEESLYQTAMNFIETPTRVLEEMTRAHAFTTGLRTGQLMGMQDEALYQFAKEISLRTMYGYATHDRARIFQGPMGNVAGLFKNWMLHHIGDWSAYAGEAFRRGNFRPLLWVATSTAGLGGLGALPFVRALDRFAELTGNPGVMENLYAGLNGQENPLLADAAFYGLPGLLGTSLQATAAAPFNDPTRDISFMFNIAAVSRMQAIGQLGTEALDTWRGTGGNPLQNERVWDRMWYAMTPRAMYKAMAQVENGSLMALRNGAPIYEGITDNEYLRNVFGLTPTTIARAWEANSRLWERQEAAGRAVSRYGEMLAQGMLQGSQRLQNDAVTMAILAGVDLSRVMQSAQARVRRGMTPSVPMEYIRDPDSARFMDVLGLMN